MNTHRIVFIVLFIFCFAPLIEAQVLYNDVGHIPSGGQIDWTNAGLLSGTTTTADTVFNVTDTQFGAIPDDGLNDYSAIQSAITAARSESGLVIIYFPAGTYNIHSSISLSPQDSNIVFQGYSAYSTVLTFAIGTSSSAFNINGSSAASEYSIDNNINKGSTTFTSSSFLTAYDDDIWIHYYEKTHPNISTSNANAYSIGEINQLIDESSSTGTLKYKTSKEYLTSYTLKVRKITPIKNVGIERLKINRNEPAAHTSGNNIHFRFAVNCWVKGVHSFNPPSTHIYIAHSSNIEVSGSYMHHAESYGGGGYGYGVSIGNSSNYCLIENNIFHYLRHSMIIAAGGNSNVFAYNYSGDNQNSKPDLCLHGSYPFANLFEHNYVEYLCADDAHGNNGIYNAFLRNKTSEVPVLYRCPSTSVLGNDVPMPFDFDGGSVLKDLYGMNGAIAVSHLLAWTYPSQKSGSVLDDWSYYYSSRPYFLSTSYSWPTLGTSPATTHNIPAKYRYDNLSLNPTYTDHITDWPDKQIVPASPTLSITNAGQIGQNPALSWTSSTGADSYKLYRCSDGSTWELWTTTTSTSYTDTYITITSQSDPDAFEAEYYVKAIKNTAGPSAKSNEVSTWAEGFQKESNSNILPNEYNLGENYPNPFNPVTTIRYQLPEAVNVKISVFNMMGQEVAQLVDENQNAGYHSVKWDASRFASGTYIYKITAGSFTATKRMVVIK